VLGATQDSVQTGQKGHTPLPPGGVVYPDIYRYVRFDPPTCYRHPPIYIFVLTSLKFWGLGLGRLVVCRICGGSLVLVCELRHYCDLLFGFDPEK